MTTPAIAAGTPTLEDKLRDRMKAQLIDLVPDETFAAMIADAVKRFVHGYTVPDQYHRSNDKVFPGEMRTMIEKEVSTVLAKMTLDAVAVKLKPIVESETTKEAIDKSADEFLTKIAPALFQGIVQQLVAPVWKEVGPMAANFLQQEISNGRLSLHGRY